MPEQPPNSSETAGDYSYWRDYELHGRRAIWIIWTVTLITAGLVYAGKAAEDKSAFVRWRYQIHEFWEGKNIWDDLVFPNPPIMAISISPIMALPPMACALTWFALKSVMATLAILLVLRMARGPDGQGFPFWAEGLVILFSFRPLLSDLHHGNINIVILFLVVLCLEAWRRGYDVLGGLLLALAITYKVTPALFVPYFMFKRSWRIVGATMLGIGLFLVIIPGLILGPGFNGQCLASWWHRMLSPFVAGDFISPQEVNQSMGGVLTRLLAEHKIVSGPHAYGGVSFQGHLLELPHRVVTWLVKGLSLVLVGLLALVCRTKAEGRTDRRLLAEFSLVALTMLFVSERSWKHHFVLLLLPYAYLIYQMAVVPIGGRRRWVALGLGLSVLLIASTSSEIGGLIVDRGHKWALYYGMYFWGAVALYVATMWRSLDEQRDRPASSPTAGGLRGPHGAARPLGARPDTVAG